MNTKIRKGLYQSTLPSPGKSWQEKMVKVVVFKVGDWYHFDVWWGVPKRKGIWNMVKQYKNYELQLIFIHYIVSANS